MTTTRHKTKLLYGPFENQNVKAANQKKPKNSFERFKINKKLR